MNSKNKNDNLDINLNAITTQKQIFEGFLFENLFSDVLDTKTTINKQLNNQKFCTSWNVENNFIYVFSNLHSFQIYFDDIIAVNKIESGINVFSLFKIIIYYN